MKKNGGRLFSAVLLFVLVLSLATTTFAETAQATRYCAVYVAPDETSLCLGWLSEGDHVTVNFAQGNWCDVTFGNVTGYVLSSNLGEARTSWLVPVVTSYPVPVVQQPVPVVQQPVPVVQQPVPMIEPLPVPSVPVIGSTTNLYTTTKLNVRSGPGTQYAKIGVLDAGSPVCVIDTDGKWYKINFNGIQGYVFSQYVQKGAVVVSGYVTPLNTTLVTNAVTTAYKGTGRQYGEVCAFPAGYAVQVVGVCGNWYKIVVNNQYAYVQRAYLSDPSQLYAYIYR